MTRPRPSKFRLRYRAAVLVSVAVLLLAMSARAADPLAGRRLAMQLGCFECHGENGMGVDAETPIMAGQDRTYLIRQLRSFADRQARERLGLNDFARYHAGMEASTRRLTHNQIDLLATYFASLRCVPKRAPDGASVPAAAKRCSRCHGPMGVNIEPGTPDLFGQKATYLKRQLRAFRASRFGTDPMGTQQERNQSAMAEHAIPLSDDDIDTIATYFSSFPCH